MNYKIFPILLLSIFTLSSCSIGINGDKGADGVDGWSYGSINASDHLTKITRTVGNFEKVTVRNAIKVVISDKKFDNKISIEGPDNIVDVLKTEVKDGQLFLSFTKSVNFRSQDLVVIIPHQKIRAIDVSGASKIEANHNMKVEKFSAIISGASKAKFNLTSNDITTKISGASSLEITGHVQKVVAEVSGASKLKLNELKAATVNVECSGASKAEVWAVNNLNAVASGASKIVYINESGLVKKLSDTGASSIKSN